MPLISVHVRYAAQYWRDLQDLSNVLVSGTTGAQIPLGQVADNTSRREPTFLFMLNQTWTR